MTNDKDHQLRCTDCGHTRTVGDGPHADVNTRGTKHTPRSKAARMQSRVASKCPECGELRFAISEVSTQ